MAIKLIMVLSLIVFLCCVVVAPAGELPSAGNPQLTTTSTTFSSWLAGGTLEELCGCTDKAEGMMTCNVRDLLRTSEDAAVVPRQSVQMAELMFIANTDALRASGSASLSY